MKNLLIIGFVWPEPNSSAAGSRMIQLIQLFLSHNWQVTFASPAADSEYMINFGKLGVSKVTIEINNSSFDDFVKHLQPNIVIFDRFIIEEQFGWRVAKHCPDAMRILNTEDLHGLRKTRHEALKKNKKFQITDLLNNDTVKREIASIYRCDLSLIISDYEIQLLKETFNINDSLLHYLPFLLEPITQKTVKNWTTFSDRDHFMTIGNFLHEPNWNSVIYLKETIWPLIKKELPMAELHIYGAYPSHKVTQLNNKKEGFHIKGRAENSKEVIQNSRVCLAPLRFGAGIKGKLTEAMLCGTPSVTTTIGAEGMLGEDSDWNGFITDSPEKFAIAAVKLYTNKNLWQQAQQNGIEIINTRFQKSKFSNSFLKQVDIILGNINKHRANNFIGNMLNFHTLRSTEYMSRWIEEKNK